jgi:hypothetical protein
MQSPYFGMTLNERIVVSGYLSEWDAAVYAADRKNMIEILERVDMANEAESIADQILSNPEFYGFSRAAPS